MLKEAHLNPFRLNTAVAAWNQPNKTFFLKAYNSIKGGVYDLFVKNPYELTTGNYRRFFSSENAAKHSKIEKIAIGIIIALSACYTFLLYGITICINAQLLQSLGAIAGSAQIISVAKKINTIGEKIFLCGSVPIYGILYALPKQLLKFIPIACEKIIHIIISILKYVSKKIIVPIWQHILQPILLSIYKVIKWGVTLISKTIQYLANKIMQAATWVFNNVFVPIWKYILHPIIKNTYKAIRWTVSLICNTIQYLVNKIMQAAAWAFNHVIVPFWNYVLKPIIKNTYKAIRWTISIISNAIQYLVNKTIQAAAWIFNNSIVPFWNYVLSPILKVLIVIAKLVGRFIDYSAQKVSALCAIIYQAIIEPTILLFKKMAETASDNFIIIKQKVINTWESIF